MKSWPTELACELAVDFAAHMTGSQQFASGRGRTKVRLAMLALLPIAAGITACAAASHSLDPLRANFDVPSHEVVCIDGVEYIRFENLDSHGGLSYNFTPHWKADATLYACGNSVPPLSHPM